MNYRMAREPDLPHLSRMRWDFMREGSETTPVASQEAFERYCTQFLAQALASGQWTYWIAEHADEIVAHVFVHLIRPVPRPDRLEDRYGYVTNVYTRPPYRSRGIGTALMQRMIAWAQAREVALLIVSPSERSIPFYQRLGFSEQTEFMELKFRT
jgi:GNAT superfamily N-acetyltransferase